MKRYDAYTTVSAQNLNFELQQSQRNQQQNNQNKLSLYQQLENKVIQSAEQQQSQTFGIGGTINPLHQRIKISSLTDTNNLLKEKVDNGQQITNNLLIQPTQQNSQIQVKKQNFILKNNLKRKSATFYNGSNISSNKTTSNDTVNIVRRNNFNENLSQNMELSNNYSKLLNNNFKNDDDTFSSDISGGFSSDSGDKEKGDSTQNQLISSIYDFYQYNSNQTPQEQQRHYLEDLPPQPLIEKPYSLEPDMIFG